MRRRLVCHTRSYVSYSHGWRRWNDSERAPGKGSLSYARRAYGVKNKMTRSAWKSRMYNGPSAVCSVSTSATRAVPWPPLAPPQAPRIPGEPINRAQTSKNPRHPTARHVIADQPPCFWQSRRLWQSRHLGGEGRCMTSDIGTGCRGPSPISATGPSLISTPGL